MPTSYRSKFEEKIAENIGDRAAYEPTSIGYTIEYTYKPDWVTPSGRIIEGKGVLDAAERRKYLAIKHAHPDLIISFVFQRDNRITKTSRTTYSAWATKHGFDWCIGPGVPSEWLQ